MSAIAGRVDVHQHLWPASLVDALRARAEPPFLDDWTLHLSGEAPFEVNAGDHDVTLRAEAEQTAAAVLLSLSAGMGIHDLKPGDAQPLLDAWHTGAAEIAAAENLPFAAWAAVTRDDPDLVGLRELLDAGFVGLEVSANWLATPPRLEQLLPTLVVCQAAGRPVLVHPGPVSSSNRHTAHAWWGPVVSYTAQLQAAWWSWQAVGRAALPDLRICFAACAGLAPAHHERFLARGGTSSAIDAGAFVDTSSYGPQGLDAVIRALGIDVVVFGSDRPYAEPTALPGGSSAAYAISVTNPNRLLNGDPR